MKRVYRRCRECGRDWNVSRLEPGGKVYICPTCELKKKLKIRKEGMVCTTAPAAEEN